MDIEIYPITATQIDWVNFIKVVQNETGESPTRGLDSNNISLKDLRAVIGSLDLENNPIVSFETAIESGILDHMMIGVIIIGKDIESILPPVPRITKLNGKRTLAILSATVHNWYHIIIQGMKESVDKEIRVLSNKLYETFKQAGLGFLWYSRTFKDLKDGTWIII